MAVGSVVIGCEPVDLNKTYRLCTTDFLAKGKDGYSCLEGSEMIVNEEDGPQLSTIVQNHFRSVSYLTRVSKLKYNHHQSIISRRERRSLSRQATSVMDETDSYADYEQVCGAEMVDGRGRRRWHTAHIALAFAQRHAVIEEAEAKEIKVALAPKIQQRIKNLRDDAACE